MRHVDRRPRDDFIGLVLIIIIAVSARYAIAATIYYLRR
jgi:hypothetical protein